MTNTWIFTLPQSLSDTQSARLTADFEAFIRRWKSHGQPVDGRIEVKYKRFVVVQAGPAGGQPGGCSIDNMTRETLKLLEAEGINPLDNGHIAYRDAAGDIQTASFRELPALVAAGALGPQSIVFDATVSTHGDFSAWERPMADTWMQRFLPQPQS